jgi:hypothetical protein
MPEQPPDWVIKLVSHLRNADHALAVDLKRPHTARRLYRYRKPCHLESLRNQTVSLSSVSDFNDPLDSAISIDFEPAMHELLGRELTEAALRVITEERWRAVSESPDRVSALDELLVECVVEQLGEDGRPSAMGFYRKYLRERSAEETHSISNRLQQGLKVACFSEMPDSMVMWSHYANDHKGFCLEYDFGTLEPEDPRRDALFPVVYDEQRFSIASELARLVNGGKKNHTLPILAAIHKSPDWQYEREWRLICSAPGMVDRVLLPMPTLTSVLLGARCSEDVREEALRLAVTDHFAVFEMILSTVHYRLERRRIDVRPAR